MKLLSLGLCSLPFLSLSLARPAKSKQGSFQIFSDSDCASPNGPLVTAPDGTCQPIKNSSSITAETFPSCTNGGKAVLYISDQEQCAWPSLIESSISSESVGKCLFFTTGGTILSAAFTCVTGTPTTSAATSPTSIAARPIAKGAQTPPSLGLSTSDQIALGVGIGIGLPALLVAIITFFTNWLAFLHRPSRLWIGHQHNDPLPPYELVVQS